MDFFKSVFTADPDNDPSSSPSSPHSPHDPSDVAADDDADSSPAEDAAAGGGGWSFGGLIKTLATRSETVIQTYRRDLEEFGSGLKKETTAIREAAARAVLDLPGSLEVGASVAQESLESVGQAIDDIGGSVWRGTAVIISQGKEAILALDSDAPADQHRSSVDSGPSPASAARRYSRFEAQVLAIQSDPNTFSEAPEDVEDFARWQSEFDLAEKEEEIESLCYENNTLDGFLEKMVPAVVDYETFWYRYYYRVHKLKQAEDARAKLVKRVIAAEEDEDLSWEVDDDEEAQEESKEEKKDENLGVKTEESKQEGNIAEEIKAARKELVEPVVEEKETVQMTQVKTSETPTSKIDDEVESTQKKAESPKSPSSEESASKSDDNNVPEGKTETSGSCKDSDFSVVSSQPSMQEEDDLGWDEIEDLGDHDDKKLSVSSGSPLKVDLRKRLSTADEDEDLSWDIEDDDEPVKT